MEHELPAIRREEAGIVGLYALIATSFPAALRVTGSGLAIGIGRGGAILGPLIGGILIEHGLSAAMAVSIIGGSAVLAAAVLGFGGVRPMPAARD